MKKCFGIISYFTLEQPERKQRQDRLDRLVKRLSDLWSDIPIMVVAQQWEYYTLNGKCKNKVIQFNYDKLGILGARHTLRKHFLESEFEYIIMLDDDTIFQLDSDNVANKYIEEIDKHPDGFCFLRYADSQLSLCAISKYIYEKEPIPNIDPQKGEGFEDRVWSILLHYKYPEREFAAPKGIKCVHFKNPNIDKLGGEVTSTWSNKQTYNWKKMSENTLEIEKYIVEHKELPKELPIPKKAEHKEPPKKIGVVQLNIDLVITYVDSTDKNWQELYNQYVPKTGNQEVSGKQRFRKSDNFKHLFRGIELYTPWINNVFLVVQSVSQVPEWVDVTKVKVILHENFVPKEFLPVFNSQAIEMFLHRIPGLSEKFLYANDDVYFIGPLKPENFFLNDKVKTSFKVTSLSNKEPFPLWQQAIINSGMLVNQKETKNLMEQGQYMTPMHSTRPYLKSKMEEAFNKHEKAILNSITKFREEKNLAVYLYDLYLKSLDLVMEKDYIFYHYGSKTPPAFIANCLVNPQLNKVMCLNDSAEELDLKRESFIADKFNKKFPNKSKYEE